MSKEVIALSISELERIGEHISTLVHLFNVREEFKRSADASLARHQIQTQTVDSGGRHVVEFAPMLDVYYCLKG